MLEVKFIEISPSFLYGCLEREKEFRITDLNLEVSYKRLLEKTDDKQDLSYLKFQVTHYVNGFDNEKNILYTSDSFNKDDQDSLFAMEFYTFLQGFNFCMQNMPNESNYG